MLQISRAVTSFSTSQGSRANVEVSGTRYMSFSAIRANPSMDDPSNQIAVVESPRKLICRDCDIS